MQRFSRAILWEYLGHPADEPPARRRVLYAIVVVRVGLGLMFLWRGWRALFAASGEGLASRLGNVADWGLQSPVVADTVLFLLGCTELAVGILLLTGAFSRVSAVTGAVLALLYLARGELHPFVAGALVTTVGSLLLVVIGGSPFLSADRFLDKVEEEERDRAPAVLPRLAPALPVLPRLGLAGGLVYAALVGQASGLARASILLLAGLLVAGVATRLAGPAGGLAFMLLLVSAGAVGLADLLAPCAAAVALAVTGAGTANLLANGAHAPVTPAPVEREGTPTASRH